MTHDQERAHCEAVACDILDNHALYLNMGGWLGAGFVPAVNDAHVPGYVAAIIARERQEARRQALEELRPIHECCVSCERAIHAMEDAT